MQKNCKTGVIRLVILALVLCLSSIFAFLGVPETADAILPVGYVEKVINNNFEWWTADEYLGLSKLKTTVHSWIGNSQYDFDYLKENPIIVAVIDSGVNIEHELFSGKYDGDGNYSAGAVDINGVGLYDVLLRDGSGNPILKNTATSHGYNENDITDDDNKKHGTHVAGIVATLIHALDLEQYIKILPIKASYHYRTLLEGEKDSFDSNDVKSAVRFALEQGADVINMSFTSEGSGFAGLDKSEAYKKAVLVAAAGNEGKRIQRYPAALPYVIGVMNYNRLDDGQIALSNSSNYGEWGNVGYDVCAAGTEIFSANGEINQGSEYGYKSLSGTSMATPIVSFGAALMAMKYKALAGVGGDEIDSTDLANLVRNAYSTVVTTTESGKAIGSYKVFDINKLVGFAAYDANIVVDDLSLLKQQLGSIRPINLKMSVTPMSEYGNGSVEWFVEDEKIGSGFEISYTPTEVGETTVRAVWKCQSSEHGAIEQTATVKISVDYMPITASNVAGFKPIATENGNALENTSAVYVGRTYRFEVNGLQNISAVNAKNCLWFVNGEFMYMGDKFDFTPSEEGSYEIKIKLNGYESDVAVISAIPRKSNNGHMQELKMFTIIFCATMGASALLVAIIIIVRRKRKDRGEM